MSKGIQLIVGLGNPGPEYRDTRHNAGAMFVDALCDSYRTELRPDPKFFGHTARVKVKDKDLRLLFPTTYMNHSGQAVSALCKYFKIDPEQVLVVYDELDFPAGTSRFKSGGGHGGHNGVRDIIKALGTNNFQRLRIGIGHPGDPAKVHNYVLGEPSRKDAELMQVNIEEAIALLPLLVEGKFQIAMNKLHTQAEQHGN